MQKRFIQQLVLVVISGGLLPLCFPPYGYWPLVLVVFPLLLLATTNTTARRAFYLGMLQGAIGYGLTLHWFLKIFGAGAVPLFAMMALFTSLFCLVFNFVGKQTKSPGLKVFLAAVLWTAIEFYRSELFFLRFPWATPGSALGPTWLSPIVGVYGASFLVLVASAAFLYRKTVALALVLSLVVLSLGIFSPGPVPLDEDEGFLVALVQAEECPLQLYVALTKKVQDQEPDLIVWPEYALPYDVRKDAPHFSRLISLCEELEATLVVGTKTVIGSGPKDWYNTALVLDQNGTLGEHYKTRPVHFFNDGIPGRGFTPVKTGLGLVATPICFDCDYSEVARRMVNNGAEFFAVPTFDAEFWTAKQHVQHALLFQLRAAENGRWLACAASSGVSQVIDPHGNVRAQLPLMKPGVVTHRIARCQGKTFFTRVGWLFPWVVLASAVFVLLHSTIQHIRRRR